MHILEYFFGPVIASNVYCDFIAQEMCTSRITGVGLLPFNMIPLDISSDNECFFENADGVMEPCYPEIGYFEWPFPLRILESEHDLRCNEICTDSQAIIIDSSQEKRKQLDLQKVLDSCNSTGIQPSIGYKYSNDTHIITNNSCAWQTLEEYENEN